MNEEETLDKFKIISDYIIEEIKLKKMSFYELHVVYGLFLFKIRQYEITIKEINILFFKFLKYYLGKLKILYYDIIIDINTLILNCIINHYTHVFTKEVSYMLSLKNNYFNNDPAKLEIFYYEIENFILCYHDNRISRNIILLIKILIDSKFFSPELIKSRMIKYNEYLFEINTTMIKYTDHINYIKTIIHELNLYENIRYLWIGAVIRGIFCKYSCFG